MRSLAVAALLTLASAACGRTGGGDLNVAQLTAVVAREQETLTPCYQSALDRSPYEHEFRLQATLEIRPDGSVESVALDQAGLQGVGPCIEKTIRAWHFPNAKAATRASLPIIFRPKVVQSPPANFKLPPGFEVLEPPPSDP
jgi:hypothetical protein